MNESISRELTKADFRRDARLRYVARFAPFLFALPLPILFFALYLLFGGAATSTAFIYLFLALASGIGGLILGIIVMIMLFWRRQAWLADLREQLAADGVKTSEVDWFTNELTNRERKSLRDIARGNKLLAEAYKETLASRLTATRILKSAKNEFALLERRQTKIKQLNAPNVKELQAELSDDRKRLETVGREADALLIESKTRLEQIEAAARRGTTLSGNEQALKLLTERSRQLPYALQSAQMEEELRRELEAEEGKK